MGSALYLGGEVVSVLEPFSESATNLILRPLGRGSTGRAIPLNLVEEMAMEHIQNNPQLGTVVMEGMKDTRWLGWSKMEFKVKTAEGVNAVIHYVAKFENGVMEAIDDFKFK